MNDFELFRSIDRLNSIIGELTKRILSMEDRVKELEKNPKIVNNYHNTYPQQPQWIPSHYKYDITCSTPTGMEHAKST